MKVAFTGGGSAGHVTPNLAIMELFKKNDAQIHYFGTEDGIEHELIDGFGGVTYHIVPSERLRRYATWKNLLTPFLVLRGILAATMHMKRVSPDVLFSKGGFVSFPVVVGAWLNRIPVLIHESDLTPGLANKLSFPFARKICVGFEEAGQHIKDQSRVVFTGAPLRQDVLEADPARAREAFNIDATQPIIMVTGGSQGSVHINDVVRESLDALLTMGDVYHLCGKGHSDPSLDGKKGYAQFEYMKDLFPSLMAASSVVICRAGANTLVELTALQRPSILVPLPTASSRGDQLVNAQKYEAQGLGEVIRDEALTSPKLIEMVKSVLSDTSKYETALKRHQLPDSAKMIYDLMVSYIKPKKK